MGPGGVGVPDAGDGRPGGTVTDGDDVGGDAAPTVLPYIRGDTFLSAANEFFFDPTYVPIGETSVVTGEDGETYPVSNLGSDEDSTTVRLRVTWLDDLGAPVSSEPTFQPRLQDGHVLDCSVESRDSDGSYVVEQRSRSIPDLLSAEAGLLRSSGPPLGDRNVATSGGHQR